MDSPKRPVYLNLLEFHFPATAIASLLHRISGTVLFLALPLLIYGLELSLQGGAATQTLQEWWEMRMVRLLAALSGWALLHHWLAGWRFLLIDVEIGVTRKHARSAAWLINLSSIFGLALLMASLI